LSSRWEGFGHVIVEAMAAGLPVVATDCPYGPADIIANEKTGLLVTPEDSAALGRAVSLVLSDPALAQRLSKHGAAAAQRYESRRVALDYLAAIKQALARRVRAH
jgi:glycosyltransferase involved in cell wall biosynthesis